jgi:hypothetical protein
MFIWDSTPIIREWADIYILSSFYLGTVPTWERDAKKGVGDDGVQQSFFRKLSSDWERKGKRPTRKYKLVLAYV